MRVLALVLATLAVLASAAHADDDDDEDGDFVGFPRLSIGFMVSGHGTRIGGQSETGLGPSVEVALGKQRWQYLVEAGFATAGMTDETTGAGEARIGGRVVRGGLGARWLARQFRPDRKGGIELFLLSLVGAQHYSFEGTTRLTRPELAFGVGVQGRSFRRPRLTFRLDARVLFTPNDSEGALVGCRGQCMAEAGSSTGFMSGIGFAW